MKRYVRFFEDDLEEACPDNSKPIASGACARIDANGNLGAKIQGRCNVGHSWDDRAGKCIVNPKG